MMAVVGRDAAAGGPEWDGEREREVGRERERRRGRERDR